MSSPRSIPGAERRSPPPTTSPIMRRASHSSPKPSPEAESSPPAPESAFECNVCFDTPRDPVVTPCGHLYCWPCLYRWMCLHADSPQCPVCKAAVEKSSVIPIYGRGRAARGDPRDSTPQEDEVPPRPSGHRAQAQQQPGLHPAPAFGMHHATFGRINPYGGNYDNVSLSTFGLFPSLFGLQIAYPHMNEPPREDPPANQEDGMSELVAKVFLLLSFFIAVIITTF